MTIVISEGGNPDKIKGGRWTVFRFFFVSVAYTIPWMAISSELGRYKLLYGPQVLLQMNIAYFLPSIPLLVVSSVFDDRLDKALGVAKTIFIRLLFGLMGCAAVCAAFPWGPTDIKFLLSMITVLGLMHGIAFSASYQMVSRFANKNTISLGLGCVGSGLIVLLVEVVLTFVPITDHVEALSLYETAAGFVVIGFLAANSLLLRHWNAIEAHGHGHAAPDVTQPLLSETADTSGSSGEGSWPTARQEYRRSLSRLVSFAPLDPFEAVSEGDAILDGSFRRPGLPRTTLIQHPSLDPVVGQTVSSSIRRSYSVPVQHTVMSPPMTRYSMATLEEDLDVEAMRSLAAEQQRDASGAMHEGQATDQPTRSHILEVVQGIWPVMAALFLSGTITILVFPFFTYVPSSGLLGTLLPRTLFFSRLFADITGRTVPRVKALAISSPFALLLLAVVKVSTVPCFFLYLKSSERFHSDILAIVYVCLLWCLGGYINTNAYVVAPRLVKAHLKAGAAGMMAITYQTAHCMGLLLAILLCAVLFGGIGIEA